MPDFPIPSRDPWYLPYDTLSYEEHPDPWLLLSNLTTATYFATGSGVGVALDADAQTHVARIVADSGVVTDSVFLSSFITSLKAGPGNCYALLDALFIPVAIRKDGANKVSTIYDLSPSKAGAYYDCVQANASLQQTWQENQIDGKPWIIFDPALGGYFASGVASIAQPLTVFVICRKDGGAFQRIALDMRTAGFGPAPIFYAVGNATQISCFPGIATLNATTNQTTLGQFTFLVNNTSSNIRRRGVSLATGGSGDEASSTYSIGANTTGLSEIHSGPIAFLAVVRQSITTGQRDYIEGLLNTTFYPSTV